MAGRGKDDGKGRRPLTSTPMPRSKDDKLPPEIDANASRILGYPVYRRPQKDSANTTRTDQAASSSSSHEAASSSSYATTASSAAATAATPKSPDDAIILKAKYLQAAFINMTAIKAQKRHREQMKTGLDSLVAYNESVMKKIADARAKLDAAEKESLLAETLQSHEESGLFDDVDGRFGGVVERCQALDAALSATMSTLEVEDVVVPQDDREKRELFEKLESIERTLIADPIVTEFMDNVIKKCEVGNRVAKLMGDQINDLEEMTNTAEEMSRLVEKETSLRISKQ